MNVARGQKKKKKKKNQTIIYKGSKRWRRFTAFLKSRKLLCICHMWYVLNEESGKNIWCWMDYGVNEEFSQNADA